MKKRSKLQTYNATFQGRKSGAIGIMQRLNVTVQGTDQEDARLNLYQTHQDILDLKLIEVERGHTRLGCPVTCCGA